MVYFYFFSEHFYLVFMQFNCNRFYFILCSSRNILVLVHHQTVSHRICSVLRDCSYICL